MTSNYMRFVHKNSPSSAMNLLLLLLAIIPICLSDELLDVPLIETKAGKVSGTIQKSFSGHDFYSYSGIPFAESPTNELRFRPPIPKKPWQGIKDGSKEGPPCLQILQFNEPQVIGSEDCLWLNVYTPANVAKNKEELKPVLVWIHGGKFLIGTASSMIYSPVFMMDHEDIVIVSLQWRLGPYGFLSTGDAASPGNYGFHDMVLGLQWVQENIHLFGGDPAKVTISGHSAGSAAVHLLTISPLSRNLMSQAIALSGSAACYWAGRSKPETHIKYAQEMGKLFDCPLDDSEAMMDCLRNQNPVALTEAQWKLHPFFQKTTAKLPLSTFVPTLDKDAAQPFMPKSPLEYLKEGDFAQVPLMTGLTSQEGGWFISTFYGQDGLQRLKDFDENKVEIGKALTGDLFDDPKDLEKLFHFYTQGKKLADQEQRIPMAQLVGDMIFNAEGLLGVHLQARKSQAPVYFYMFNFRGNWTYAHEFEETKHDYGGVAHLDDISYFMRVHFHPVLSPEETQVMKHFTSFIANFVRNGQPSQDWPAYKPGLGATMQIDNPPKVSYEMPFPSERMKLWMDLLGHSEDLSIDFPNHDEL